LILSDLYIYLIIALAFGGQALFGFGGGLVAVPLLSLALNVRDAVMLVAIYQFLFGFMAITSYRFVAWFLMAPLLSGMLAGVCVGVWALPLMRESALQVLLALTILGFLGHSLLFPQLGASRPSRFWGTASGIISGFLQGCLGMGGPPVVMYLKRLIPEAQVFRASMILTLSVANAARIPLAGYEDLFSPHVQSLASRSLPVFLLAAFVGHRYHRRVSEVIYFRVVYVFLGLAACVLLIRAFW
jgi:uncharacterized membrane protein YfcA